VEQKDAHGTREAALQGWTKWLIHHDFDHDKTTVSSFAKPYLKLGFLFDEPEFGISPEVALPMVLKEIPNRAANDNHNGPMKVAIQSTEIGKQLACTSQGSLYTMDMVVGNDDDDDDDDALASFPADAQWRCDWHTPEICAIISTEQGMRLNVMEGDAILPVQPTDPTTAPPPPPASSASWDCTGRAC